MVRTRTQKKWSGDDFNKYFLKDFSLFVYFVIFVGFIILVIVVSFFLLLMSGN